MVSKGSGCLDLTESTKKYPLSRNHFDINKFGKPEEEDYQTVREIVEKMVENLQCIVRARMPGGSMLSYPKDFFRIY